MTVFKYSPEIEKLIQINPNLSSFLDRLFEFMELNEALVGDIHVCGVELNKDKSNQFWRRVAIKNVISTIEGFTYALKELSLKFAVFSAVEFTSAETALLNETNFRLKDNGEVKIETSKLRTKANILFALKMAAKSSKSATIEFDKDKTLWEAVLSSIETRNRITHPKNINSLLISDDEYEKIEKTMDWFTEMMDAVTNRFMDFIFSEAKNYK